MNVLRDILTYNFLLTDGVKLINWGWLSGYTSVQLRLHSNPIKMWKPRYRQQTYSVRCTPMDHRYKEVSKPTFEVSTITVADGNYLTSFFILGASMTFFFSFLISLLKRFSFLNVVCFYFILYLSPAKIVFSEVSATNGPAAQEILLLITSYHICKQQRLRCVGHNMCSPTSVGESFQDYS